jgi:hypothetical protein
MLERVGGVVRLKPFDKLSNFGVGDSLYFSFITGKQIFLPWPRFENGKFDEAGLFPRLVTGGRELPNEVVKAGTQVVSDLSDQDAKSERDGLLLKVLQCVQEKVYVTLWERCVTALLEKSVTFDLQIRDVLAGPF